MSAGDAFGIAITVILAVWIVSGNMGRHGAGSVLLSVPHPRRTSMIGLSAGLAAFMLGEFLSAGKFRVPWGAAPILLFYISVRRVEFRENGVFANPSFYAWEDVEWAGWLDDTLFVRSSRRFVSPRSLKLTLEGEDRVLAERVIEEKVKKPRSEGSE